MAAIVGVKGRALGGVLGAFTKRQDGDPLVKKMGTTMVGWEGKYSRPVQLWGLDTKIKDHELKSIEKILKEFNLDEKL